jgi:hypothetical protein
MSKCWHASWPNHFHGYIQCFIPRYELTPLRPHRLKSTNQLACFEGSPHPVKPVNYRYQTIVLPNYTHYLRFPHFSLTSFALAYINMNNIISDLHAGLAQHDQVINQLLSKVEAMELQQSTAQTSAVPNASSGKKKKSAKVQALLPQVTVRPSAGNKSMSNSASKKTTVKQRARLVTPASAKKSPLQMTKKNHLEGFKHTKVSQLV